jgi:hypothetical protein
MMMMIDDVDDAWRRGQWLVKMTIVNDDDCMKTVTMDVDDDDS